MQGTGRLVTDLTVDDVPFSDPPPPQGEDFPTAPATGTQQVGHVGEGFMHGIHMLVRLTPSESVDNTDTVPAAYTKPNWHFHPPS